MEAFYRKKHRKWRSAISFLLVLCLVTTSFSLGGLTVSAADTQTFDIGVNPESVKAELSPDGRLTLSGIGATKDYTPETAPFSGKNVVSVEIAKGVSSLGDYLFYDCGSLCGELVLPDGLISIGKGVFSGESIETAPHFSWIRNEFTQCTVADKKVEASPEPEKTPAPTVSPTPSPSPTPSVSPAPALSSGSGATEEAGEMGEEQAEIPVSGGDAGQGEASTGGTEGGESASAAGTERATSQAVKEAASGEGAVMASASSAVEAPGPQQSASGGSAAKEASSEEPVSDKPDSPEISLSPAPSQGPEESKTVDDNKKFTVETIHQQRMGSGVFYPDSGNGACFVCSAENDSFREAAREGGYQEADRLISAAFDCGEGEGGTITKELPVLSGAVVLPEELPELIAPENSGLFSYTFGGWIESQDEAGAVREAGSEFQAGAREDLYFVAVWNREVLVKLSLKAEDGRITLTVPEIEGYDVLSYLWQVCDLPEGELPKNEELLPWKEISGESGAVYEKALEPEDENRAFRCVVTLRKQSFFSLFSLNDGEEVALASVSGAQAYAAAGQYEITLSPGTGAGAMDPVTVRHGDYGVIPACSFTAPSGANIVFDGWEDSSGTIYDPGQIVPMTGSLALTARWGAATIRYVDGKNGGENNEGQTSSAPCMYFKPRGSGTSAYKGAYTDLPASGSKYTNIVVVCGDTTLGTGDYALDAKNATITSVDPVTGTRYDATLTLSGSVSLEGDTCFRDIRIVGGGNGNGDSIYAMGRKLYMGSGIDLTEYYTNGVNLYGGAASGTLNSSTNVLVTSGTYLAAFGGSENGNVTGDSSVQISGDARVGVVFGGGWNWNGSQNDGNTEVLIGGNAQVGMAVAGNRSSDHGSGVTGTAHVVVGGNASVTDFNGRTRTHAKIDFNTIGFVGGSGADASNNEESSGNVRQGTLVEIRENAHVDGNVYGGSGDGWAQDPNASHPTWMGAKGGTEVIVSGSPTIGGSVYGGGNKRACEGDSTITIAGGSIAGGVYGGGSRANVTGNSTVTITGGSIAGSVYGGGDQGDLTGNGTVTVSGGQVGGSIYGGGKNGAVGGSTAVEISGGDVGVMNATGSVAANSSSVYGGGEEGTVGAGSSVAVSGGTVKNSVFGGSKGVSASSDTGKVTGNSSAVITGGSLGAVDEIGNPLAGTGNVFGGGEYAATSGKASVTVGQSGADASFSIQGSVYGGGSLAPVGTSSVELYQGEIKGSVYGAGLGAQSSTGGTTVNVSGGTVDGSIYGGGELGSVGSAGAPGSGSQVTFSGGTVVQNLFGAGKGDASASLTDGCVYGPVSVQVSGGQIQGTVYGGGDNGTVGAGSLSGSGASASMTVATLSSTSVTVTGGTISDSVFAGGSGSSSDTAFGAVFGSTTLRVTGGTVGNGVYGGCNTAYISGDTSVSVDASQGDVSIGGTVFGGGNLPVTGSSEGEVPTFQEIYLVQGKVAVEVDGSGGHNLAIGGSVYGSGNLTLVKDHDNTKITIRNFDGSLESVQRAGRADIVASHLCLIGAKDVTEAVSHKYSLSQIGDLRLIDGTLLRVDREARDLEAMGNYVSGSDAPSSAAGTRSTLQVYQGKKLQIRGSDGAYGLVSGVLWLDVVKEAGVESTEVGVSIQASKDTNYGDGVTDTGAFVKADTDASRDLPLVSGLIADSHTYWQLGSKTVTSNETIQATHADNGGTGLATQTFHITTSSANSEIVVTQRVQNGEFFLVKPTEKADGAMDALPAFDESLGQNAGNTFALRMEGSDSESTGAWSDPGAGSYILTADDSHNGGVPGLWKRSAAYPTTAGTGGEGEFTFSLLYDPTYTKFTGGTVELTFKEYPAGEPKTEETLESTTVLTLTLEGDESAGAQREAYVAAGREFAGISGTQAASITDTGAVTAYFSTTYLPLSAGAENMALTLYQGTAEAGTAIAFPEGTKIVLADRSLENRYHYYMYRPMGETGVSLSKFASMGGSGSAFYPGPTGSTAEVTENLLFAIDFSQCTSRLSAGAYQLRLTHSETEVAMQTVGFTVTSTSASDYKLEMLLSEQGGGWAFKAALTPTVPAEDTRFADGALIRLILTDSTGSTLGFPGKTKFSGEDALLNTLIRSADGSVSFLVSLGSPAELTMDFAEVPSEILPSGQDYGLKAELRPRTGLQVETDSGAADGVSGVETFRLAEANAKPERALQVELSSGSSADRVMDVSESEKVLTFTVTAQAETGDQLKAEIYRKENPADRDSYKLVSGASWCSVESLNSGGIAAATLKVPKGTASGTYRVLFRLEDANGIATAEVPYNFIVK